MRALITDSRITRTVVWISLCVTSFMLDTRFSRLTRTVAGVLLSLAYFIIGNGDGPGYSVFKLGYTAFTAVMDTPWLITVLAFEILTEAEDIIRKKGKRK